jgi:hypothetical protein
MKKNMFLSIISLVIFGCRQHETNDNSTQLIISSNSTTIVKTEYVENTDLLNKVVNYLDSNKVCNTPFSVSAPALVTGRGADYRMFYVILKDTLLEVISNKNYTDNDYQLLFNSGWNSKYDWAINLLLYKKNVVNGFELKKYSPNNIDLWRIEKRSSDSTYWSEFYKSLVAEKVSISTSVPAPSSGEGVD